jgi:hypothetical protein
MLTDFWDGTILSERELDKASLQLLYLTQEALDDASEKIGLGSTLDYIDAKGFPIRDVGDPTGPTDAIPLRYYNDVLYPVVQEYVTSFVTHYVGSYVQNTLYPELETWIDGRFNDDFMPLIQQWMLSYLNITFMSQAQSWTKGYINETFMPQVRTWVNNRFDDTFLPTIQTWITTHLSYVFLPTVKEWVTTEFNNGFFPMVQSWTETHFTNTFFPIVKAYIDEVLLAVNESCLTLKVGDVYLYGATCEVPGGEEGECTCIQLAVGGVVL